MTKKEKDKLRQLFKANPVLTVENSHIKSIFQQTLKTVIDDVYSDFSEEERVGIYGETLLEVEEIMSEFSPTEKILH